MNNHIINPLLLPEFIYDLAEHLPPHDTLKLFNSTNTLNSSEIVESIFKKICEREFTPVPTHLTAKQHCIISEMNQYKDQWMSSAKKVLDSASPALCLLSEIFLHYSILSSIDFSNHNIALLFIYNKILNHIDINNPQNITELAIASVFYDAISIFIHSIDYMHNTLPEPILEFVRGIQFLNDTGYRVEIATALLLFGPPIINMMISFNSRAIRNLALEIQNSTVLAVGEIGYKLRKAKENKVTLIDCMRIPEQTLKWGIRQVPTEVLNLGRSVIQGISQLFLSQRSLNPQ